MRICLELFLSSIFFFFFFFCLLVIIKGKRKKKKLWYYGFSVDELDLSYNFHIRGEKYLKNI